MQLTRRVAGYLALAAAAAAVAVPASRPTQAYLPTQITAQAGQQATTVNCSGTLGSWSGMQHGQFGDLTTTDGDPAADVIVVGDSILTAGVTELATWLRARGKTLAGNYWSGRPTRPAVDWALSLSTKPRVLVIVAGTNDIMSPAAMAGQVARVNAWAATAPRTRIVWVDVQAARPATALCDQRNSMWINAQIRSGLDGDVCGWSTWFASDPRRFGWYMRPDGVHPIEGVGTNFWAAVVGGCIL